MRQMKVLQGSLAGVLRTALLASLLFALSLPSPAQAAPGDLDPTFGVGGKVTTDFGGGELAFAVAVQPDGKIVTAGGSDCCVGAFRLARHNPDGTLDIAFGNGGKVTTTFRGSDSASALALQPDGKIVVAGSTGGIFAFALARYLPDGSLDATFGSGGKVTTNFGLAFALAIQPDGKIVVAGGTDNFLLARYNPDGSLDPTFGAGGKVITDFGGDDSAFALAFQADGKIVVAGKSEVFTGIVGGDFALARYNSDGSLDATFGNGGKVTTDFINHSVDGAFAVALQPDGKIVVGGATTPIPIVAPPAFALGRYLPNGSLDATFGNSGKVITSFGGPLCNSKTCLSDGVRSLVLQPGGKIVAAGRFFTGLTGLGNFTGNFALASYHPDGSVDTTFGDGGKVTTDFGGYDGAHALALQPDGKLVVAGQAALSGIPPSSGDFALARYRGDPTLFLALAANKTAFAAGETLTLSTRMANSGPDTTVDQYLGALLPAAAGPAFGCPANDAIAFVTEPSASL